MALQARDMASQELERADMLLQKIAGHSAAVKESMDRMAGSVKAVGLLGAAVAGSVVAFFAESEHAAVEYQDALQQLRINANLTATATDEMGHAIMAAAIGTTSSATDMASALAPVSGELARIQGGALDAADATKVLAAAQDLAVSSNTQLKSATKSISDLLLVYHENASNAAQISDTLYQAHAQLGIGVDRLSMMLQRLQPRIAGSGVDMQHLLGIVREMGPTVGQGQRAMMLVGGVLQNLQNPSKQAQSAFAALGIQIRDSSGNFIGFGKALDNIKAAYDRLPATANGSAASMRLQADVSRLATDQAAVQTKGLRAQEAALKSEISTLQAHGVGLTKASLLQTIWGHNANLATALVQGGSAAIEQNTQALTKNGTAQSATNTVMADAQHQLAMLPKTIHDIQDAVGMVLLPALNRVLQPIEAILVKIAEWADANPQLTAAILAVVGAVGLFFAAMAFGGPVLRGVTDAIKGLREGVTTLLEGFLSSPVGLVTVALLGLAAAFAAIPGVAAPLASVLNTVNVALQQTFGAVVQFAGAVLDFLRGTSNMTAVMDAWHRLTAVMGSVIQSVVNAITTAAPKIAAAIAAWVPGAIDAARKMFEGIANWIVTSAAPTVLSAFGTLFGQISNFIQSGGVTQIVSSLTTWTTQFLGWAASTGIKVAAGLIAAVGAFLVTHAPEIIADAVLLGGQIIVGIGQGIMAHPEAVAQIIFAVFAGSVVLGAIVRAAGIIKLAFNEALAAGGLIKDLAATALFKPFNVAAGRAGTTVAEDLANAIGESVPQLEAETAAAGTAAGEALGSTLIPASAAAGAEAGSAAAAGMEGTLVAGAAADGEAAGLAAAGGLSTRLLGALGGLGAGIVGAIGTIAIPATLAIAIGGPIAQGVQDANVQKLSDTLAAALKDGSASAIADAQRAIAQAQRTGQAAHLDSYLAAVNQLADQFNAELAQQGRDRNNYEADATTAATNIDGHLGQIRDAQKQVVTGMTGLDSHLGKLQDSNEAILQANQQLAADSHVSITAIQRQVEAADMQNAGIRQLHADLAAAIAAAHQVGATFDQKLAAETRAVGDIVKGVGNLATRDQTLTELRALRTEAAKEHNTKAVASLDKMIGQMVRRVDNSKWVQDELAKAQKIIDGNASTHTKIAELTAIQKDLHDKGDTKAASIISKAVDGVKTAIKNHTITNNVDVLWTSAGASGSVKVTGSKMYGFAEGANTVPYTGPALVHAGEMVIPAQTAEMVRRMGGLPAVTKAMQTAKNKLGGWMNYIGPSQYTPPSVKTGGVMPAGAFHLGKLHEEHRRAGHPAIYDVIQKAVKTGHSTATSHHVSTTSNHTASVAHVTASTVHVAGQEKALQTVISITMATAKAAIAAAQAAANASANAYHGSKQIPKLAGGTDYFPTDGLAYLHKGEAVLNPSRAHQYRQQGFSPISPGGFSPHYTINVYLNGRKVNDAVSRTQFEEERMYAGAATPGSPF